jgi:antitoxin ChpS
MRPPKLTTNLRRVCGSVILAVPPPLLDLLDLQPGAQVGIAVERGRLIVEARQRPRYTLDQLLAQCNPRARRTRQDQDWLKSKPVGGELL